MRRFLGPILALVLPLLGCCFSGEFAEQFEQEFNQSFCAEYQRSFVDTCTNTCVQNAGAAAQAQCATGCQSALQQDATWTSRCGGGAVAPAVEPVPPAASGASTRVSEASQDRLARCGRFRPRAARASVRNLRGEHSGQ